MKNVLLFFLLLFLTSSAVNAQDELSDLVLVIDPGHGDRAWGVVPGDPGATAQIAAGTLQECTYTWDTAMRLKRLAEEKGATVFLTLEGEEYESHDWPPEQIPEWHYKTLVDFPEPRSEYEALHGK